MSVPNMLLPPGSLTLAAALAAAALAAAALDAAALAAAALAAKKALAATAALATTALATAAFPATATLTFAPVALRAAALPEQPLVFALAGMKCIASGLRAFAHTFLFASRSACYRARLLCRESLRDKFFSVFESARASFCHRALDVLVSRRSCLRVS